jgi:hypothetical protein
MLLLLLVKVTVGLSVSTILLAILSFCELTVKDLDVMLDSKLCFHHVNYISSRAPKSWDLFVL